MNAVIILNPALGGLTETSCKYVDTKLALLLFCLFSLSAYHHYKLI
jgi:hypothetical protein